MSGWCDPGNDDPAGYRECWVCGAINPHRPVGCGTECEVES